MILEHEIPNGSKLYFGKAAKVKREIEKVASEILDTNGFEEIVTPIFSYHQHQSIADEKELIRVNDVKNNNMSLRADSTIDVVILIIKNGFTSSLFFVTHQQNNTKLALNLWARKNYLLL